LSAPQQLPIVTLPPQVPPFVRPPCMSLSLSLPLQQPPPPRQRLRSACCRGDKGSQCEPRKHTTSRHTTYMRSHALSRLQPAVAPFAQRASLCRRGKLVFKTIHKSKISKPLYENGIRQICDIQKFLYRSEHRFALLLLCFCWQQASTWQNRQLAVAVSEEFPPSLLPAAACCLCRCCFSPALLTDQLPLQLADAAIDQYAVLSWQASVWRWQRVVGSISVSVCAVE